MFGLAEADQNAITVYESLPLKSSGAMTRSENLKLKDPKSKSYVKRLQISF
jgi:hypothetical protein